MVPSMDMMHMFALAYSCRDGAETTTTTTTTFLTCIFIFTEVQGENANDSMNIYSMNIHMN